MKWIAVADHQYYPEVEEFADQGEAELWLEKRMKYLVDEEGIKESRFYVARVYQKEIHNTNY